VERIITKLATANYIPLFFPCFSSSLSGDSWKTPSHRQVQPPRGIPPIGRAAQPSELPPFRIFAMVGILKREDLPKHDHHSDVLTAIVIVCEACDVQ
jgi:hypothetical protein